MPATCDKPRIVKLGHEHIREVMELERICFTYHWTEEQFKLGLERGAFHVFGVYVGDKLAGYMAFSTIEDEMEVLNLGVLPEHRRQGLASLLLGGVLEVCERMNMVKAFLDVRETNVAAIDLYKKFGFKQYGARKRYYPDTGEDALLYVYEFK